MFEILWHLVALQAGELIVSQFSFCFIFSHQIDWNQPGQNIHNFIRGMDKVPGAWTQIDGQVYTTYDCIVPCYNRSSRFYTTKNIIKLENI